MSAPHLDRDARGRFIRDDAKSRNGLLRLIDIVAANPAFSFSSESADDLRELRAFVETIDEAPGEREKENEDEAL